MDLLVSFTADLLRLHDVAVDSRSSPSHVVVYLKRSKNDIFGEGTSVHLCPVAALLGYLAIHPFFFFMMVQPY